MASTDEGRDVTIVVDALGGDDAPGVVLEGTKTALAADPTLHVLLAGPEDVVSPLCDAEERAEALVATQSIGMDEHPAQAVRHKRDSSIVVGCHAVKDGRAEGFFSAGSTGACMTAATLIIGRIKGVTRPAIASMLPSEGKPTVLTDVGANADWKPEYLLQFAQMGAAYSRVVVGCADPKVALLNIGAEETKGSEAVQQAHALLAGKLPEFAGNAEGTDLLNGRFDVIVTDGFTGNIALKTMEGTAKVFGHELKRVLYSSTKNKMGGLLVRKDLNELKRRMGSEAVGAAPLLGVRGVVMIGHGSSTAAAIASAIRSTAAACRGGLTEAMARAVGA